MPRPASFVDLAQEPAAPNDFELRKVSWRQVTLFRGTDQLAEVKSVLGIGQSFEITSDYDLHVGRTTVRQISTGDSMVRWLSIAELLEGQTPAVCIEVARPEVAPIASDARLRFRLWSHHAAWALHDHDGRLVLTAHRAWRDSEAKRKMVGGYRLHAPLNDEDARLIAIAASLFWSIESAVFDLSTA